MIQRPHRVDGSQPTLVVFCKRPALGQGKSRLAKTIGQEQAYLVAVELLNCALEDAANWPGNLVFTVSNPDDIEWANALTVGGHTVISQSSGNLGERINKIDTELREQGHNHLAFIGTDAPMLTMQHYNDVIQQLNQHDVVLSQADDGGVGIMANATAWPDLSGLPWSTENLGESLASLCQQHHLCVAYSLPSFDIDEEGDLLTTYQALATDTRLSRMQLRNMLTPLVASPTLINTEIPQDA